MSTCIREMGLLENRNSRILLNFLSSPCQDHGRCSIVHLLNEWHIIFWIPFFHVEIFHQGHKPYRIPLSTTSQITGFWSFPKCPSGGTYIDHCATCLEGEKNVDMGAIGYSSAGGVGQEELQTADQVPGDVYFNGVGLAQHRNWGRKGLMLELGNLNGEKGQRRLLEEIISPSQNLSFLFYPQRNPWGSKQFGQIMLLLCPKWENVVFKFQFNRYLLQSAAGLTTWTETLKN